jgi:hypothetical protein
MTNSNYGIIDLSDMVFPIAEQSLQNLSIYDDESILFKDSIRENNESIKKKLVDELSRIPAFVDPLKKIITKVKGKGSYVADITEEMQYRIDKGDLVLKEVDGKISAILRDKNGKLAEHIPLKKESLSPDILSLLNNIAMQIQLKQIVEEMKNIKSQIDRVLEGQQDDRIARCESSVRQLINARLTENESLKQMQIANAIQSIEEGKSQILLSMLRTIEYIKKTELGFFDILTGPSQNEIDNRMLELTKNLSIFIKSSCIESIQYLSVSESKAAIEPLKYCYTSLEKHFDEPTRQKLNGNIGNDLKKNGNLEENFWVNKFPKVMKKIQEKINYIETEQKYLKSFSNKEVAHG